MLGSLRTLARPGALLGLACAAGCTGGGGGSTTSSGSPVGAFRPKPGGGYYFEDAHESGHASRLALLEILWGRLVDVHGLDASGAPTVEPVLRDFVIGENVLTDPGRYRFEVNPITQQARLVVERVPGAPDDGRGTFDALVRRAAEGLGPVLPRADDAGASATFSFVARNATLVLRFDDLLDDGAASVTELAQTVRVLTGYPPSVPLEPRLVFDPCHGGVAGGRFHSTRVLIDMTVSEAEAADSPVPLQLNSLGLPRSELFSPSPNVSLHIPTALDPGTGQFALLVNLARRPIDPEASRPYDDDSPTRPLERAMRAGNQDDPNNGFLLDFDPPRVVGTWPCEVRAAEATGASGFEVELALAFTSACRKTPARGDIVAPGERFLEVQGASEVPGQEGVWLVQARALNVRAPVPTELLGLATYHSLYRTGLEVERGCWVRFTPPARAYPSGDVPSNALTTVRFTEPMDPASARPFDSLMTVHGGEGQPPTATALVVGRIRPSLDLRDLTFAPSLPYAHQGERPLYHLSVLGAGGVTDLAGNELDETLLPIEFSIDPASPRVDNASFVMRLDSTDELEPIGYPDLRGQFTYQFTRGTIRPREVGTASRPVDRSNPIVGIMPNFAPGVATPLSPLGSRLQAVWRYCDLGWSIRDESKYNLDVIGLSWSPARGLVTADFYEQFEIRVAHSKKLPDEQPRQPITGGMKWPISGLWEGPVPFEDNLLQDPESPPLVLHARALGYRVDPHDLSFTASGTPIMPWPINQGGGELLSFTWRDTAALARGGDFGVGVPLDAEIGAPTYLENPPAGNFAGAGQVPTVGLPLLMEFRCYPSQTGIGLNPLAINIASNASAAPNFRAYSTGGFDTLGQRVTKNPDLELAPTGGFNPGSRPPGKPTRRTADNSLYLGQLDYVVRVSRAHTIWIDSHALAPQYAELVLEPSVDSFPPGTAIVVDFRGADRFDDADIRPFNAAALTPYGDPRSGSTVFHGGDPTWKHDVREVSGARYIQMRFSFVNNIDAGLVAELSAVGVAYVTQ